MKFCLLALVFTSTLLAQEIRIAPFQPEEKQRFESILRRATALYPLCIGEAKRLGRFITPLGSAYTPQAKPRRHFIYEIADAGGPLGELEIHADKHPLQKMLSLKSCEVLKD